MLQPKLIIHSIFLALIALVLTGCAVQKPIDVMSEERLIPGIFLEEPSRAGLPRGVELRKISDLGLQITKDSEGFEPELYNDPAGFCTIGYGHLIKKSSCNGDERKELASCDVSMPGEFTAAISYLRGEEILRCDMVLAEMAVTLHARDDLTDNEYSALVDFTFNVGAGNFKNSTLLRKVNAGNYQRIPYEFRRWVYANGKVYNGLKIRREKEIELFFGEKIVIRGEMPDESELIDIRVGE